MSDRAAGLLLHPTSLPGRFGIGELGPEVDRFLDWAARSGQKIWQILPLGAPAGGASPYNCLSAFAGNRLLLSLDMLHRWGLLSARDLSDPPDFPTDEVAFAEVAAWKEPLLRRSWERFEQLATPELRQELETFTAETPWLEDWVLFSAARERFAGQPWWQWERSLARRHPDALAAARRELEPELAFHRYLQFLFFRQWHRVRREAARRGLEILGDVPIYVAYDSAEVWARPDLFDLDDEGRQLSVAGVPPDYFSATGQRWGNPIYRWDRMKEDGYRWWIERLAANLRLADRVRLDHFRGFAGYWKIPADAETAIDGEWAPGPGRELFDALRDALGELPLIAEDLGEITADVHALRRALGLPGMRVLQFGLGTADSDHAPHHFEPASVVYTGTHDNDTCVGWYRGLDRLARRRVRRYSGGNARDIHWALIRLAYTSVAELAVVPMQDVLGLGSRARMNTPGRAAGNWRWRLAPGTLDDRLAERLRYLAEITGR